MKVRHVTIIAVATCAAGGIFAGGALLSKVGWRAIHDIVTVRRSIDDFRVEDGHRWEDVCHHVDSSEVAGTYVDFSQDHSRKAMQLLPDGTYSLGLIQDATSTLDVREVGNWQLSLGDTSGCVAIILEPRNKEGDSKYSSCGGNYLALEKCDLGLRLRMWNDEDSHWYYTRRFH
jgi:hypothetical protein